MIVWILSKLLPKQRIYILLYAMCGITLVCNHISNCAVQRLSNSVDVLESIPEQDRGTALEILWWIRGQGSNFKPYVKNKIYEIQLESDASQWRPVPTDSNPADICSRGTNPDALHGPCIHSPCGYKVTNG